MSLTSERWEDGPPVFDEQPFIESPSIEDVKRDIIQRLRADDRNEGNGPVSFDSADDEQDTAALLDDVQIMSLPDPEWIVEGVIPKGGRVGLVAPPDAFKTTLAADLLVAVATGQSWHGHRVISRCASLYLGPEERSGFKVRLAAAKRARGLSLSGPPIGVYAYQRPLDLRNHARIDAFLSFIQQQGGVFGIVAIDTYSAAMPGANENSSEDATLGLIGAQRIGQALDATVIIIHHTNAGGTRERGHSALRGDVDTMLMLDYIDDVVHVRCDKQRNAERFKTITLKPVPGPDGGMVLRLAGDVLPSSKLTPTQTALLDCLRDIGGREGVTKAQWREASKSLATVTERAFYKVAALLEERRYIVKIGTHFRVGEGR